jgi:hypothetical protein
MLMVYMNYILNANVRASIYQHYYNMRVQSSISTSLR